MAVARSGFVSLDCADPLALGEFWAAMLGGEIMFTSATTVGIRTAWVWLSALKVADYVAPTWPGNEVPKQIHAVRRHIEDLGTKVVDENRLRPR
jgi:hypothetical protein